MNNSVTKFLNEIKVLDLSRHYSGDLTSMFLSDFGALVFKYINKSDEASYSENDFWHRNKNIIHIDFDNEVFAQRIQSDLKDAHILIHDYQFDTDEYKTILSLIENNKNEDLIVCHISAFPVNSELKHELMIDALVLARAGEMMVLPGHGEGPKYLMHPVTSVGCGINSATGVITALISNFISSKKIQNINSTLMGGLLLYASNPYQGDKWRDFASPTGGAPFYSNYKCVDGYLQIACIHSGFVEKAAIAIGIPEILVDPKYEISGGKPATGGFRIEDPVLRQELYDDIAKIMITKTCAEWSEIFEESDVPYAKINNINEALQDEQIIHNKLVYRNGGNTHIGQFIDFESGVNTTNNTKNYKRNDFQLPLEGFKALEVTNVIAGPVSGRILANLGVEVIKMEPPGGEISRPFEVGYFQNLNRNKNAVCINTKTEKGKSLAQELIKTVDIYVENMRPGASERVGYGKADLDKLNPTIVQTHIAAYGNDGPYVHRPGLDPIAQSITGLQSIQGGNGAPVLLSMLAPTDFTAGGMAALGTVAGLYNKIINETGSIVNTNLLAGGILLNGAKINNYLNNKDNVKFINKDQNGISDFNRAYKASDGWLYIYKNSDNSQKFYTKFNSLFNEKIQSVCELEVCFESRKIESIIEKLKDSDIHICKVNDPTIDEYDFLLNPVTWDQVTDTNDHPSLISLEIAHNMHGFGLDNVDIPNYPKLGEHNLYYLSQLGYSKEDLNKFESEGILNSVQ